MLNDLSKNGAPKEMSDQDVQQFISNGFLRIDNAFSPEIASEGRALLWNDMNCQENDPSTWTQPVIRLGEYTQKPFVQAANTTVLHKAFDLLVGKGNWFPRHSLGTFPIRFPSIEEPGDTGWHVDASFPGEDPTNYMSWRINVWSKGRALLMLFLFSDVSENDAPSRIRIGSHLEVAKILEHEGESGLSFMELASRLELTSHREEILATGKAGTVYLCHPHLAHASQPHRGQTPRFMAQPPLLSKTDFILHGKYRNYSPVELAIKKGINAT
jgi:hypothetical protein